jgi:hypothetical protein
MLCFIAKLKQFVQHKNLPWNYKACFTLEDFQVPRPMEHEDNENESD